MDLTEQPEGGARTRSGEFETTVTEVAVIRPVNQTATSYLLYL